jgi:shikimate dehydrogenase
VLYQDHDVRALMSGPLAQLYCCIGNPVVGNPTQYMIEQAFKEVKLPYRYLTMNVEKESLGDAISGLKALNFSGFNITSPFKVSAIEYVDSLTPSASLIGAINCVYHKNDQFIGDNTDGKGFLTAVSSVKDVSGMNVLIFGAGGASRAIISELALHGASHITIVNRSIEKAKKLQQEIGCKVSTTIDVLPLTDNFVLTPTYDLIVQGTSVGLFDEKGRLPISWEEGDYSSTIASDVVFNPTNTRFLQEAKHNGCTAIDGLGMLVYQGAIAFKEWTNKDAPLTVMKESLIEAFSS